MPFTFAHPSAVIPLYRRFSRYLVLSALIIGSMVPDFEYFLPVNVERAESHSVPGILWFCLPVGIGLYLAFHLLLKRPLICLLPESVSSRIAASCIKQALLPRVAEYAVIASLLIGVSTHLAWDALTHRDGLIVQAFPLLRMYLFTVADYNVYPYKILQHASTVAGSLLLLWWARDWLKSAAVQPGPLLMPLGRRERRWLVGILLLVPIVSGLCSATSALNSTTIAFTAGDFALEATVSCISTFGIALFLYSALWHALLRQRQSPS